MNNLAHNNKIDPHFMIDLKVNSHHYFRTTNGRNLTITMLYKIYRCSSKQEIYRMEMAFNYPGELTLKLQGCNYTKSQVKALSHSLRNDSREQWIDSQERQGLK